MTRARARLGLRGSAADQEKRERKNKDELFVQKIKNFFFLLSTTACESMERKQNNIKIQNIFTSIVKQHAEKPILVVNLKILSCHLK